MGKPFEGEKARCPIYNQIDHYLMSNGWTQIFFNYYKTGLGDLWEVKYEGLDDQDIDGKTEEILYIMEVIIKGSSHRCDVSVHLDTFLPSNKLNSISHDSEAKILKNLEPVITN